MQRKNYSAEFKTKVALAAIKGNQTINEVASFYSVYPNQVLNWKKQALAKLFLPDSTKFRTKATISITYVTFVL